jgi:glutamate/tyrosine decarboxylase-like PLP-dependent enzyme
MRELKRWVGCGTDEESDAEVTDRYGGFISTNGSSATLYCLQQARDRFASESFTVFYSAAAHYSIAAALHTLGIARDRAVTIHCERTGEMDAATLSLALRKLPETENVIVCLTCGTTMLGGFDDISEVVEALDGAGIGENRSFIHVDGALMAPAVLFASNVDPAIVPRFDYHPRISSLVWSTHKWPGVPYCGSVLIVRKSALPPPAEGIAYIETDGGTCSRSGAVVLSLCVRVLGFDDEYRSDEADRCIRMAAELANTLQSFGAAEAFCKSHQHHRRVS